MNKLLLITTFILTQSATILADSGIGGGGRPRVCIGPDVKTTITCEFKNNKKAQFTYIGAGRFQGLQCQYLVQTPPTNNQRNFSFKMNLLDNYRNSSQGKLVFKTETYPNNNGYFCDGVDSWNRDTGRYECSGHHFFRLLLLSGHYDRYIGKYKLLIVDKHGTIAEKGENTICDFKVQRLK